MAIPREPHVVVLVPDGVGYRNFVLGRLWQSLPGPITILHSLNEADLDRCHLKAEIDSGRIRFKRLPPFRETPLVRCLREAKSLSQLYRHDQDDAGTEQLARLKARGGLKSRALIATARMLANLGHRNPGRFDAPLRRAVARSESTYQMTQWLKREKPSVVFCTHQRASAALPAMTAARALGIPTATFIFSWDNLPKGRMPIEADRYLVWGSSMARQMARYFPNLGPAAVVEVGTPQFEPYLDQNRFQSRTDFCSELELDQDRPIVCFSGDDTATSPKDPTFLRDLAKGLADAGCHLPSDQQPQILFRRAPVDLSDRYDAVLRDFPQIKQAPPRWLMSTEGVGGDWQGILPTKADVDHLVNLVRHSDLVVNLGSTMAMDFALFDKPAVFLNYEPDGPTDPSWNTAAAYRLPHFRTVHAIQPVHWANSAQELGRVVLECLNQPQALSEQRRRWIDAICKRPLDQASERCAQALIALGIDHAQ